MGAFYLVIAAIGLGASGVMLLAVDANDPLRPFFLLMGFIVAVGALAAPIAPGDE